MLMHYLIQIFIFRVSHLIARPPEISDLRGMLATVCHLIRSRLHGGRLPAWRGMLAIEKNGCAYMEC